MIDGAEAILSHKAALAGEAGLNDECMHRMHCIAHAADATHKAVATVVVWLEEITGFHCLYRFLEHICRQEQSTHQNTSTKCYDGLHSCGTTSTEATNAAKCRFLDSMYAFWALQPKNESVQNA